MNNTKGEDIYDLRSKAKAAAEAIDEFKAAFDEDDYFAAYGADIDIVDDLYIAQSVFDRIRTYIDVLYPEPISSASSVDETTGPVTLRVEYYPYERYTDSGQKKARVSGKDLLEALKKMISHMELYMTPDFIEDEGLSAEEVLQSIIGSNGDGCDFISYLENETTGDVYIDEDYVDEEDWD